MQLFVIIAHVIMSLQVDSLSITYLLSISHWFLEILHQSTHANKYYTLCFKKTLKLRNFCVIVFSSKLLQFLTQKVAQSVT